MTIITGRRRATAKLLLAPISCFCKNGNVFSFSEPASCLTAPHDAIGILAGTRINANPVVFVDENRHLQLVPARNTGVLHDLAGCRIALGTGIAPLDLALDEGRKIDFNRIAVQKENAALDVVFQEIFLD